MSITLAQIKEFFKNLPYEAKEFVNSNEVSELVGSMLKVDGGIYEDNIDDASIEVWYALLGIQTLSQAIENIAKNNSRDIKDLSKLQQNLQTNIFDIMPKAGSLGSNSDRLREIEEKTLKIKKESNGNKIKPIISNPIIEKPSNVGDDFEQILLNQARAMQPARKAEDIPPSNLPRETEPKPVSNPGIQNYPKGQDPYREPAE